MTDWIQRTADDYAAAMENLMPSGAVWNRDPDGGLMRWIDGNAQVWGEVEAIAWQLLTVETDPRYCYQMLPDWELNLGLPDPCVKQPETLTLVDRHNAIVNKLTTQGGASRAFFVGVAAKLGYNVTIDEFVPFQFGLSSFGGSHGAIYDPSCRFYWRVNISGMRMTRFQFGYSRAGNDSFLHIQRADDLECVFNRWKPAHTIVIFDYKTLNRTFEFFFPY